jgi:hypothetical protein
MNPDTAIKPWLETVGRQFGIRRAYNFRHSDPSTGSQEPYFTYRILRATPKSAQPVRTNDVSDTDEYAVLWSGWRNYETVVRIRLFREINGVMILAKCADQAQICEPIKRHFDKSSCAFRGILEDIEDETPDDIDLTSGDCLEFFRQRMDVIFNDTVSSVTKEKNGVVNDIDINLGL